MSQAHSYVFMYLARKEMPHVWADADFFPMTFLNVCALFKTISKNAEKTSLVHFKVVGRLILVRSMKLMIYPMNIHMEIYGESMHSEL